jgi:hypothetical protein
MYIHTKMRNFFCRNICGVDVCDLKNVLSLLLQLNEVTRKKTAEIDGQLTTEVQSKLLQKQEVQKTVNEKVVVKEELKQFRDSEKDSSEALNKLCKMQVN